LPDWKHLVEPLAQQLRLGELDSVDPLDVAQWYTDTHGRDALEQRVRFGLSGAHGPSALHNAVARLGAPVLLTTNFDTLLEQAIQQTEGVPPDAIIEDAHIGLIDEARRTTVAKLHGCVSLMSSIVLTRDDYEVYLERHPAMVAYVQALLATRTFLFVGYSLTDPDLRLIYSAIRRALGRHKRKAYLLDAGAKAPQLVAYWRERGLEIVLFDAYEEIPVFVDQLARDANAAQNVPGAIRTLQAPPPEASVVQVGPLMDRLDDLRNALQALLDQATDAGLVLPRGAEPVDIAAPEAAWVRQKARALLEVTQAVDRVAPLEDPMRWLALADLLYQQGDPVGAIVGYNAVLRPSVAARAMEPELIRRVQGNLARANAAQDQYARAEWLLRRCVFKPGRDQDDREPNRSSVYERLCQEHLRVRPSDASELVYAITRRAEDLRDAGRASEAFEALCEARYALEPILDIGKGLGRYAPSEDLFGTEADARTHREQLRQSISRAVPRYHYYPKAWAFNFLGKSYRLSCEAALDLALDPSYYVRKAVRYLHYANNIDPLLPYPYAHRLMLVDNPRLSRADRDQASQSVRLDLVRLQSHVGGEAVFNEMQQRFPASPLLQGS
jgi:hypothetical protein